MTIPRRRFLHLAAGAAALPAASRMARAQAYPSRTVRIVVGFPAGQAIDIFARLMAEWLQQRLGQTFIVENRPGAAANVATEMVARSPADGYTLLIVSSNNVTVANSQSDGSGTVFYLSGSTDVVVANGTWTNTSYEGALVEGGTAVTFQNVSMTSSYAEYQDYLEVTPDEFRELFDTILINVTAFFRDRAAWDYVEKDVIPALIVTEIGGDAASLSSCITGGMKRATRRSWLTRSGATRYRVQRFPWARASAS